MKKTIRTLSIVAAFNAMSALPAIAAIGGSSDGGGKGVLCTTPMGRTLEALDIYEAKRVYRFGEAPRRTDLLSEFTLGLERLDAAWRSPYKSAPQMPGDKVQKLLDREFLDKVIFIPDGTRIPLTDDATVPVLPTDCQVVQVAVFNSLGVQLDCEYWEMMDPRSQAAIVFHEWLYPIRKKYGATNSDEIRRFVGQLFSAKPPTPRFAGITNDGYLDCKAGGGGTNSSPVYDFVVYKSVVDGSPTTVISFRQIDNETTLGRTIAVLLDGQGPSAFDMLVNPNAGIGMSVEMKSESRDETRHVELDKIPSSSGIYIRVKTRDVYTGQVSQESSGWCELKMPPQ